MMFIVCSRVSSNFFVHECSIQLFVISTTQIPTISKLKKKSHYFHTIEYNSKIILKDVNTYSEEVRPHSTYYMNCIYTQF